MWANTCYKSGETILKWPSILHFNDWLQIFLIIIISPQNGKCIYIFPAIYSTYVIYLLQRIHHVKCRPGWSTSWNQDCRRNIKSQMCRWYPSNGRKWKGTKEPPEKGEERRVKKLVGKLNIQKTNIMASGPITPWQIEGENVEVVIGFIFLGSKITADSDCSHDMKRRMLFGRKAMTNLDSIFKSRDITLPTKICIVKATVFLVVMYSY